ncbi:MAG TPA: alpha/beta hydrolase-fold protein [Myxococcaceae bacterium]|jgi:predicted alpha/beta superfamily hydrolase
MANAGTWKTFGPFDLPDGFPSRVVRAFIPPGVRKNQRRPVLYMFDGQNVFGDEGSFAGGWHAHEAVQALDGRRYHVPIVVAIEHGNQRRMDELTPWGMGRMGGGKADRFLDWVVGTVVPLAHRELPVLEGPVGASVAGSSLGGLAALYAHYRHPDVFGGVIAMSPSLFVGRGKIYSFIGERDRPAISRVYLDVGGREAGGRLSNGVKRMADQLEGRGYDKAQLLYRYEERAGHNEQAWRRRLPRALRFMMKK